jgi:hypothetical protein
MLLAGDVDSRAASGRCLAAKGTYELMTQPRSVIARITRPTIAKATVTAGIRVESELLRGWMSWVMSSHFHCYDFAS